MERREKQRIERAETAERRERQRNYTDKDDIDINIDIISNYQIVSFGISSFFSQSGTPSSQAFCQPGKGLFGLLYHTTPLMTLENVQ